MYSKSRDRLMSCSRHGSARCLPHALLPLPTAKAAARRLHPAAQQRHRHIPSGVILGAAGATEASSLPAGCRPAVPRRCRGFGSTR